ncbi:FYN-binding protein 1 isoform X1 [Myiozetetes cayanensis]|uniref:FYN-binding protein 1 isoform X1 n=2 Tax=Myiozetetes cayanensis TaxID=478635 RepID=UPI0021608DE3|nr:FYN-binding protein 1 isoform X1 [Myiozetetes cayanensis]XP_050185473.1 FYN-binding protein 1 isoform X1 [Myiozetetes cayanensis]
MEKSESGGRDTEDDLAHSQPLKIPKTEVPEGIQQARKAALEKLAAQENATCTEGPSTSSRTISHKPSLVAKPLACEEIEDKQKQPHLNTVAQVFGVYLQPVNRENNEKTECTKFPINTCYPAKEDPKPQHPKPAWNKFPSSAPPGKEKNTLGAKPKSDLASQKSETRTASPKVTGIKEKLMPAAQENVPKPSLFKKPSFNTEVSNNKDTSNKCDSLQSRLAGPRTNTHSLMKVKEMGENNSAAEAAGSHLPKIGMKPAGHSQTSLQGTFINVKQETEEKAMSVIKTTVTKKVIQEGSNSPHKFCKTNTALGAVRSSDKPRKKEDGAPTPRQRVLAPEFKTSTCPAKPNRPPSVELQGYQRRAPKKIPGNEGVKLTGSFVFAPLAPLQDRAAQFPSPKPISHPDLEVMEAPSLPPRNIKPSSVIRNPENEENYDDVEFVSQGHGSTQGDQEGDIEMYEDINDIRSSREKEKKQNKEDKRRMEQEKREQKEKEKKELELRKKFKLVGPIEVLHQARACVDYKGGKNELTVKQGDKIEIIRLTDNPEGKWLGRIGGCCGYIKTTMVEIDYDSLKRKQQAPTGADVKFSESDMDVYDDVGQEESSMSLSADSSGAGNVFPFPPPPSNEDIYDEIGDGEPIARSVSQDEDKNGIWSWGILKRLKVKDDKKKSIREKTTKGNGAEDNGNLFTSPSTNLSGKDCGEDVYDDVDSSDFPPPPPDAISSNLESFGKRKLDEEDVQKHKKMEKEEKQFKHVGEIKVLFSTTTIQNLPKRRWGSKELHIKPGESLDIIESTDDTKVLCRNKEGKYGYVLRSNLVQKDI